MCGDLRADLPAMYDDDVEMMQLEAILNSCLGSSAEFVASTIAVLTNYYGGRTS